ncbi:hypothetical protein RZN22_04450 [Bacillaceae bacterium S4-13-58]
MKDIDWHMFLFVGVSIIHEYWILNGLPQIYYWEVKKEMKSLLDEDSNNRKIA